MHKSLTALSFSILAGLALSLPARAALSPAGCEFPAEVAKQADAWLAKGYGVGAVIATVGPDGKACISSHGLLDLETRKPVEADSIFEIGSVTKVFTGLALARLSEAGKLKLEDTLQSHLPTAKIPKGSNREITLKDLATHTSGLPRMPNNLKPANQGNPYADYSAGQLWDFLAGYRIERPVGSVYEYSNLGFGLLEEVLKQTSGQPYERMLNEAVISPLGLRDTGISLARNQLMRFATGHEGKQAVPHWDFMTLGGAGALRSSAADLSDFVAAAMGARPSPLSSSFALAEKPYAESGTPNLSLGLAWHLLETAKGKIVMHDGGTGGFKSFVAYLPKSKQGVVVIANSTSFPTTEFGLHLLLPQSPLPAPRAEIEISEAQQNQLVGEYLLESIGLKVVVTREQGKLMAGFVGQGQVELHPVSASKFFLVEHDVWIEFGLDAQGRANEFRLTQAGQTFTGKRQIK